MDPWAYQCEACLYFCIYDDPNRQRHISSRRHNVKLAKEKGISLDEAIQLSLEELHGRPQRGSFLYQNNFRVVRHDDIVDLTSCYAEPEPQPPQETVPVHFQTELAQVANMMGWECAVCLESLTAERFHLTPCFHKVCRTCVRKVDRCPVCRYEWQ